MEMLTGGLSAAFWGVLLLSIVVFVHEGGHYLTARLFKVRVTEFYLGLPCRIKLFHKSKSHGTEVGVTPFLLGGYNRICGMEANGDDELLPEAFAQVQKEGRISAEELASRLDVSLDRAYELLVALSDWAAIRPYFDPELGETPNQSEYPASFETLARDPNMLTEYDDGHDFTLPGSTKAGEPRPISNADSQIAAERSRTYLGCGFFKRVAILVAGPLVNIVLAFILITSIYATMEFQSPLNSNTIGSVVEDSIAEECGLKANDTVISVGDTKVSDWNGVSEALKVAREKGEAFPMLVERDGAQQELLIKLPEGETVDAIGVYPQFESYRLSLGEAIQSTFSYAKTVATFAARLINPQHTMEVLDSSSSVVGISIMASQAASSGIIDILAFMAAISMSLGFMNLLPIPPLDGGKILIEVVQAISRRTLSVKVQNYISYAGLAFFIFVFVVVVRNDLLRFVLK